MNDEADPTMETAKASIASIRRRRAAAPLLPLALKKSERPPALPTPKLQRRHCRKTPLAVEDYNDPYATPRAGVHYLLQHGAAAVSNPMVAPPLIDPPPRHVQESSLSSSYRSASSSSSRSADGRQQQTGYQKLDSSLLYLPELKDDCDVKGGTKRKINLQCRPLSHHGDDDGVRQPKRRIMPSGREYDHGALDVSRCGIQTTALHTNG